MKNIVLSAVAVLAMSSFAVAGGDIAPVEEPVIVAEPVITDSGFYLGLAYGLMGDSLDVIDNRGNFPGNPLGTGADREVFDLDHSSVMLQAGYKFNSYVAIEGRYWFGISDDTVNGPFANYDVSADAWGIYVKPMYPVTDAFDIYALLGYGATDYAVSTNTASHWSNSFVTDSDDGFSWGLGASYAFTDNVAVFVDYVSIYSDDKNLYDATYDIDLDRTIDTWNFGVTYQF